MTLGVWYIFYIAVQQIENNIFVPLILGKTGLNPVTVIIALLVGYKIAGIPVCYRQYQWRL